MRKLCLNRQKLFFLCAVTLNFEQMSRDTAPQNVANASRLVAENLDAKPSPCDGNVEALMGVVVQKVLAWLKVES